MPLDIKQAEKLVQQLKVLLVDDNVFMRQVVRGLLLNIGVRAVVEAGDGIAGLDAIRVERPDLVILDWEMPMLNGSEFVRIVRSPMAFPVPDIPIIVLSGHGERRRVIDAVRLGVNEFLCKPVSAKLLFERMVSIVANPRTSVQLGDYYGPQPRRIVDPAAERRAAEAGFLPQPSI